MHSILAGDFYCLLIFRNRFLCFSMKSGQIKSIFMPKTIDHWMGLPLRAWLPKCGLGFEMLSAHNVVRAWVKRRLFLPPPGSYLVAHRLKGLGDKNAGFTFNSTQLKPHYLHTRNICLEVWQKLLCISFLAAWSETLNLLWGTMSEQKPLKYS